MFLSESIIERFQEVLERKYGRKVSVAEATEILIGMVNYFDLLAKIYHEEQRSN